MQNSSPSMKAAVETSEMDPVSPDPNPNRPAKSAVPSAELKYITKETMDDPDPRSSSLRELTILVPMGPPPTPQMLPPTRRQTPRYQAGLSESISMTRTAYTVIRRQAITENIRILLRSEYLPTMRQQIIIDTDWSESSRPLSRVLIPIGPLIRNGMR